MPITKKQSVKRLNLRNEFPKYSKATPDEKTEIKRLVGDHIVDQINKFLDGSKSPVSNGKFKSFKEDKGVSLLFEDGDLRSAIKSKPFRDGVDTGVFAGSDESEKAFAHNTSYRGHPYIKERTKYLREFTPKTSGIKSKYKQSIINGIKRIINEVVDGN